MYTARKALAVAREKARTARADGSIYRETFDLANGRTLTVYHAPAYGGGSLFGAWCYSYVEPNARARRLVL